MLIEESEYLAHYGILRKSGRYPWGSGGNEQTNNKMFLDYVDDMRKQGLTDTQIARGLETTTTQLRAALAISKNQQKQERISQVEKLVAKGMGNVEIGKKLGLNESSVRALREPGAKEKADALQTISKMLKDEVAEKKYIDIGKGNELLIGVTDTKLKTAVAMLREEGYKVYYVQVKQLGTGKLTNTKVLVSPDTTYSELYSNRDNIKLVGRYSDDGGKTLEPALVAPKSIDPSRVGIVYKEAGGDKADGVIFVRPGVEDVSLGDGRYAQVRVKVGETHYLKGMAMYKEGLPDGVDLLFNTNKSDTGDKFDAMKPLKDDPDNPFGAQISRQVFKKGEDGKKELSSVMNLVNEEGDWGKWSKSLSSQMLSKQSPKLAKEQLDMAYERRLSEFERISSLTNPSVKKKLLESFGDECDSASVHLKAAGLPRQGTHVILPVNSLKPDQVFAPNFVNGERVVLIRYPHGGRFEIPELTVNNKHPESNRLLKGAKDAIGIHHSVAERLSGADFDGDTVLVIPNNSKKISTEKALEGLKGFDPKTQYRAYDGMPKMSARRKQQEMGDVSNLITDMTIKGAPLSEIVRAVRHSMVVIDAEKHNLDYKRSAVDNGIASLKQKYQGAQRAGAATLISRAGSQARVPKRELRKASLGGAIDAETGKRVYQVTAQPYVNKSGKLIVPTMRSTKLAETEDAFSLSSGTPMENIYAEYSNKLKALANRSRKESVATPRITQSVSAKRVYSKEVASLNAKLAIAQRNAPLERQAQIVGNSIIKARLDANPDLDDASIKKMKAQALNTARARVGAKKTLVNIEPNEWEAIQAGAISASKLDDILSNTDLDLVKEYATPINSVKMTSAKTRRAQDMLDRGYTRAEVAAQLGVSLSTLDASTDVKEVTND